MVTRDGGMKNFTECPGAITLVTTAGIYDKNAAGNISMGFNALGGLEYDFSCAAMCQTSPYYSFSDVGEGPPPQNCTTAISDYAESRFPIWGTIFFMYAGFIGVGIAAVYKILRLKRKHLENYERFEDEKKLVHPKNTTSHQRR